MRRTVWFAISIALVLSGCSVQPSATPDPSMPAAAFAQPTPIPPPDPGQGLSVLAGEIMKHPERYEGQVVVLVGYFRGQDLLDEVKAGPPKDRIQDWVIEDDSGAIFVADQGLLPFPSTSHEIWRIVRVSGQVELMSRTGTPYVLPSSVQWEGLTEATEMLPAFCDLAIHRHGGPDGLDHHIYWYNTGNLVAHDATTGWQGAVKLGKGDIFDWKNEWNRVKFFDLQDAGEAGCDAQVRYTIAALHEKRNTPHFVTLCEGSIPAKLRAFIAQAVEKAGEARPLS